MKRISIEELDVDELKELLLSAFKAGLESYSKEFKETFNQEVMTQKLLTQQDAAEYLRISVATLISWRHKGLIQGHTIGKMVYFYMEDIHNAIRKGNIKIKQYGK